MTTHRTADDVLDELNPDNPFDTFQDDRKTVAKQQLLADILSLPCLQDEEESIYHPDAGDLLSGDAIVRNDLRVELVKAMTAYFIGGDVGVDGGASEEPTPQEQVGGKQVGTLSAESARKDKYGQQH